MPKNPWHVVRTSLQQDDMDRLKAKAQKAGMSLSAFIRHTVNGKEIAEAPHVDVLLLFREVRHVGIVMEQLLKRLDGGKPYEAEELRKALEENRTVEKRISEAYGSPWQ